jgi:polyisoprenoid-binding protein YceI
MKRALFLTSFILFSLFVLAQSTTQAGNQTFFERFDTKHLGESGTYNFDRPHSFIGFKVKHNGLIEVPGFFRDFTGKINYDAADVTKSSVEFIAKATSVDTGVGARDNHLRTKDFFEVEKYPEITFKSTKIEKKGKNWLVTGDFTMKGVTKSISLPVQIAGFLPGGERSGPRVGITGETIINRREYGVNYDAKLPSGIMAVDDNVKIVLQIEAVVPKAAPAKVE